MAEPNSEFKDKESKIIENALNSEYAEDPKNTKLVYELKDDSKEWMHTIYEEAWRLYRHEDENAAQRNSSYLTVFVLLFTGIGYVAFHIIESFSIDSLSNKSFCIKTIVSLGLIIAISILILLLLSSWFRITRAGHMFELLREDVIQNIEKVLKKGLNGDNESASSDCFFSVSLYEKDEKFSKLDTLSKKEPTLRELLKRNPTEEEKEKELDGFYNTERIINIFCGFALMTLIIAIVLMILLSILLSQIS